jgi:regulator of RNase E activity RraA
VFARGVTPTGPLHRGPGEINYPICAGGIVVEPGDIIVADAIGVVVIPQEIAADLLERLQAAASGESNYAAAVAQGDFSNDWVDALLDEAGLLLDVPSTDSR